MFLASFMPFYVAGDEFDSVSVNAWGKGLFPLASFVALFGVVLAILSAVRAFGNVKVPERILTLDVKQQGFVLAFACVTIMLGYLVADTPDKGVGFWLSIMATFALIVGSIMDLADSGSVPYGVYGPPTGFPPTGYGTPGTGAPGVPPYGGQPPSARPPFPPGGQPPGFGRRLN